MHNRDRHYGAPGGGIAFAVRLPSAPYVAAPGPASIPQHRGGSPLIGREPAYAPTMPSRPLSLDRQAITALHSRVDVEAIDIEKGRTDRASASTVEDQAQLESG